MKRYFGLFLTILSWQVFASDWHAILGDTVQYMIDWQSITQVSPSVRKAWLQSNEGLLKSSPYISGQYLSYKSLQEFNCSQRSSRVIQIHYYDSPMGAGKYLGGMDWGDHAKFSEVIPDTIGEAELNYVCNFMILKSK